MKYEFDDRDQAIVNDRLTLLDAIPNPRVGDFVRFACGTLRRISHVWEGEGVQTSNDGFGFYLGEGYVSFSGTLYRCVRPSTLTLTDEKRTGRVWLFHHNYHEAGGSVETTIPFRVYTCSEDAPE